MTHSNYPNNDRSFSAFWRRHLILCNILLMLIIIPILAWCALVFVDVWTDHGATAVVPNVKTLSYDKAVSRLEDSGLKVVISDSVYDLKKTPGEVVDINPKAGAVVKPGREVYLTIVSFSPQQVILDVPVVDQSVKAAIAYLKNKGIRNIKIIRVPSQYPDLVHSIKWNDKNLNIGSKVPVTATITLEVGELEEPIYESNDVLNDAINAVLDADEAESKNKTNSGIDDPETTTNSNESF